MHDCVRLSPLVHLCVEPCVCAWIFQLEESVHVHYIRQSTRGVPQRACAAVCLELSAPAGSAIPIYPSAAEAGGKSAGHHCRRFHIRGTRLPVRGPLWRGDEGGRPQGCSRGGRGRSERRAVRLSATLESEALCFLGRISAKLHICLTPGAVWCGGQGPFVPILVSFLS